MADASRPSAAVFDIDGTVADCRHREQHAESDPPNWEAFFEGSDLDEPLPQGVALALQYATQVDLIWLTGRPERYRPATTDWLRAFGLPATRLHMRPDGDLRSAATFKSERLAQLATEHEIAVVVDDDDRVVAALRRLGWPVLHARWMPL